MLTAQHYHAHAHGTPAGSLELTYDARFLRRKVLKTTSGEDILVDLPQTTSLDHGGVLKTASGDEFEIVAAPEELLEVTGENLVRLAWHIGNRHTPCQIEEKALYIQKDHVLADMLTRLGATLREVVAPFTPEGGAYGHGRTHGHSHGHSHGHGHAHDHAHDAGHYHAHD